MQSKLAIVAKQRGPGKLLNSEVNTYLYVPFTLTAFREQFISSTVLSKLPESSSWVYVPTRRTNQIFLLAQRRENAAHAALVVDGRLWDGTWRA
ncbi:Esterase mpl1 [Fusarium oxysporum f. sp. albedinis]|nr:Esterase mpl1 [Fusarium oxysporum f. sp. albedinis]